MSSFVISALPAHPWYWETVWSPSCTEGWRQDSSGSIKKPVSWSLSKLQDDENFQSLYPLSGNMKLYLIKKRSRFLKMPRSKEPGGFSKEKVLKEREVSYVNWFGILCYVLRFSPMVPNAPLLPKAGHRNQNFSPSKQVTETLISPCYHLRATDHKAILPLPLSEGRWLTSTWEDLTHICKARTLHSKAKENVIRPCWGSLPSLLTQK